MSASGLAPARWSSIASRVVSMASRARARARALRISPSTASNGFTVPASILVTRSSTVPNRPWTGWLTPPSGSAKAASATALSNSSLLVSVPRVRSFSSVPRSAATASKVLEPSVIALRAASAAAASGNTICWIVRFSGVP